MGAQWKQAGREANANKRGQIVGKLAKEIIVAAKMGDPNPVNNARLRAAVEAAKKASVPRDTIERAIKRGSGQLDDGVQFELITYEGFAPHKVPVIVECLTDNKNRTAADIRVLFRKGQLGAMGAVAWMFDRKGVIEATHAKSGLDLEEEAIEANAQEVEKTALAPEEQGSSARFYCDMGDLDQTHKALLERGWVVSVSELSYIAKSFSDLTEAQTKEVVEFLNAIDDHDDTHRVYVALKP